ncbi:unnamed protein product [Victoria cruziana]
MHGRRSLEPELISPMPNVNRLCRELIARSVAEMGQQIPAGEQIPPCEEPSRLLREFFIPTEYDREVGGIEPQIGAAHYEIKASTINMLPFFHGLESEDLYHHINEFLDVCSTLRISHIEDDALKL